MHKFKTVCDVPLKGKRVLIRADLNAPINDRGEVTDDARLKAAIPTIQYVTEQGGKAIIMSHLGRPGGQRVTSLSLAPIASRLSKLMDIDIILAPDCVGENIEKMTTRMKNGDIIMLENLRFHLSETEPEQDHDFARQLARLGDIYVNDAFGTAHRKHTSTYELPKLFEHAVAGFLIEKEVLVLNNLLTQAPPPFFAIIGGSKISSKIGMLDALLDKIDGLFIGGAMVFTFMRALGYPTGNSVLDEEHIDTAKQLMKRMKSKGIEFHLPKDLIEATSISNDAEKKIVSIEEGIESGWIGVDIGPDTIREWKISLNKAGTIFWNGPMGIFEIASFANGTREIAKILAESSAMTIVGGGDSAAAIAQMGVTQKITRLSTGGGATLEFIEHGTLPCLEIL